MSSPAASQPLRGPHQGRPEHSPSKDELKARSVAVTSATGLVIGSIIGTGVFTMPAVLVGAGTSSPITAA